MMSFPCSDDDCSQLQKPRIKKQKKQVYFQSPQFTTFIEERLKFIKEAMHSKQSNEEQPKVALFLEQGCQSGPESEYKLSAAFNGRTIMKAHIFLRGRGKTPT